MVKLGIKPENLYGMDETGINIIRVLACVKNKDDFNLQDSQASP